MNKKILGLVIFGLVLSLNANAEPRYGWQSAMYLALNLNSAPAACKLSVVNVGSSSYQDPNSAAQITLSEEMIKATGLRKRDKSNICWFQDNFGGEPGVTFFLFPFLFQFICDRIAISRERIPARKISRSSTSKTLFDFIITCPRHAVR